MVTPLSDAEREFLSLLLADVGTLKRSSDGRALWSERQVASPFLEESWSETRMTAALRNLIASMTTDLLFADELGYGCVDQHEDPSEILEARLASRPHLLDQWRTSGEDAWDKNTIFDFMEFFYDLASYPRSSWYHDFCSCGWHPGHLAASRSSGRRLFALTVNELLTEARWPYTMEVVGEHSGEIRERASNGFEQLARIVTEHGDEIADEVDGALHLFLKRDADRTTKRLAVISLARVLESKRSLIKAIVTSSDEDRLFEIANKFDFRHAKADQKANYGDQYMDWIFWVYLATINLIDDCSE